MAHPNAEVVRTATEALSRGDMESFLAMHNDDVVVHVGGRNPLSGDHAGKDAVVQLMQRQMELLDSPPEIHVHDALGSDTHGVVLNSFRATRGGRTVETTQTIVAHVRDGKIAEVWVEFGDQYAIDELATS